MKIGSFSVILSDFGSFWGVLRCFGIWAPEGVQFASSQAINLFNDVIVWLSAEMKFLILVTQTGKIWYICMSNVMVNCVYPANAYIGPMNFCIFSGIRCF